MAKRDFQRSGNWHYPVSLRF